jgi:nucleoside-diphosphate-sugar epimerase
MKVLITGATGFLGEHVVRLAVEKFDHIVCFVRPTSDVSVLNNTSQVELRRGDVTDKASLIRAMHGADALIYLVPLNVGNISDVVAACLQAGVTRTVFVGNTQVFTHMDDEKRNRLLDAEAVITSSHLDYTILRPTMIYGSPRDRNMIRLIRFIHRWPVIPIPGSGRRLLQPVHVQDVAKAVVDVLDHSNTIRKAYNISGKHPHTYNEIVDLICKALGVKRLKLHIPPAIMLVLLRIWRVIGLREVFSEEQVIRLSQDRDFDHREAAEDFDYSPISFEEGITQEVQTYLRTRGR